MSDPYRLHFRKGDFLAVASVLFLALGLSLWLGIRALAADEVILQVYQNGELLRECSLAQDDSFLVEGEYSNRVRIQNGEVRVIASDCPGEDCVHSGGIRGAGRAIVCLPNRMELRLVGTAAADIDITAG